MTDYRFITEEKVEHSYDETLNLPVDMGAASERLTDRMARTLADNKAIDGMAENEKVVKVCRLEDGDEVQIWPTSHTKKVKDSKGLKGVQKAIDEINDMITIEDALADAPE